MMIQLWQIRGMFRRLLIRLGLKKRGRMVPGAFEELFKPGLRKEFEQAYSASCLLPEETKEDEEESDV